MHLLLLMLLQQRIPLGLRRQNGFGRRTAVRMTVILVRLVFVAKNGTQSIDRGFSTIFPCVVVVAVVELLNVVVIVIMARIVVKLLPFLDRLEEPRCVVLNTLRTRSGGAIMVVTVFVVLGSKIIPIESGR